MYLMSFGTTEWEFLLLILKLHCVAFKDFYISISLVKVSSKLLPEFTRTCLKILNTKCSENIIISIFLFI